MYGRRSAGKRIRMEEQGQEQGQYDQYGNYYGGQQDQDYSNQGQEQVDSSFDPIAFYQQQRSEMLLESSHHVQASQDEIQRAQQEAAQRDQMQMSGSEGGRRSRSAAAAAKAALSMMTDEERPAQVPSPTASPVRQTRPRMSRTFSSRSGRGRPPGNQNKVL